MGESLDQRRSRLIERINESAEIIECIEEISLHIASVKELNEIAEMHLCTELISIEEKIEGVLKDKLYEKHFLVKDMREACSCCGDIDNEGEDEDD